ncbi:MAG: DUF488 domain-containing protein [Myxococcota bacterium]
MRLCIKRIHAPPTPEDGLRILVDRLWPRGISRDRARIDHWAKTLAPSRDLRRWFDHRPERWPEFRRRYFAELDLVRPDLQELATLIGRGPATLLFASKEERMNNASALRDALLDPGFWKG